MVGDWWRILKYKDLSGQCARAKGRQTRAEPDNYLKTHPPPPYSSRTWLLYYAGGLKLDLSYIQYTAELVWDLSRGLIEVYFNGGIVDKLVKSKR